MKKIDLRENNFVELALLNAIQADPDISQAKLAQDLGVAIGTVNLYLKRFVEKGSIKVDHVRRRKLRYVITPNGDERRKALISAYLDRSFSLFRQVRQQVWELLGELEDKGFDAVRLEGDGDLADVCRLTCLEWNMKITQNTSAPVLIVDGLEIRLELGLSNKSE